MQPLIQPFGRLPNSISPIDDNGILVIRDYAENVKRMLEMIARIDISVPAEYISEVIPIRYAKADDIANALNSLGGSGGATVSIGSSTASPPISGIAGNRPAGTAVGRNGQHHASNRCQRRQQHGHQPARPAPDHGESQRHAVIRHSLSGAAAEHHQPRAARQRGGGQQPIQLFGQTKIIANESSSSLLIYATRPDMDAITNIIAKLDVPLAQVLIEAVIVDYTLGNTLNFGVSAAQNPKIIPGSNPQVQTAGGVNNGQPFFNFAQSMLSGSNSTSSPFFPNNLPGGAGNSLSYFGNIGPSWNVALQAAQSDSHASIIQRPRIQTSQAKPAQFFVGDIRALYHQQLLL